MLLLCCHVWGVDVLLAARGRGGWRGAEHGWVRWWLRRAPG